MCTSVGIHCADVVAQEKLSPSTDDHASKRNPLSPVEGITNGAQRASPSGHRVMEGSRQVDARTREVVNILREALGQKVGRKENSIGGELLCVSCPL